MILFFYDYDSESDKKKKVSEGRLTVSIFENKLNLHEKEFCSAVACLCVPYSKFKDK